MNFTDRINKTKPYFRTFNVAAEDGAAYAIMQFPHTWTMPDIQALKANYKTEIVCRDAAVYFVISMEENVDQLFDCIDYVITFNKNVEERKGMLQEKMKELSEIFATEPIERLARLQFTFGDEDVVPTKKTSKKGEKAPKKANKAPKVEKVAEQPKEIEVERDLKIEETGLNNISVNPNDNDLMALAKGLVGE